MLLSVKPAPRTISILLCLVLAKNPWQRKNTTALEKKKRGSYRAYSNEQIAEFINLVNSGMSQRKAAEKCT
jgi:hypothetical protein